MVTAATIPPPKKNVKLTNRAKKVTEQTSTEGKMNAVKK